MQTTLWVRNLDAALYEFVVNGKVARADKYQFAMNLILIPDASAMKFEFGTMMAILLLVTTVVLCAPIPTTVDHVDQSLKENAQPPDK